MDQKTFGTRMVAVDRAVRAGDLDTALRGARDLREELGAEHIIDASKFSWPLYYELRVLHAMERWDEAVDLMEDQGFILAVLSPQHHAHGAELTMEATVEAGRAELLPKWAATFFFGRLRGARPGNAQEAMDAVMALVDAVDLPSLRGEVWQAMAGAAERLGRTDLAQMAHSQARAMMRARVA